MAAKPKRGRGRPTAEMQQIYAMINAEAKVKELFADKYVKAAEYIVGLVDDQEAAKPVRLQAAKIIKEQVESWMQEHFEEQNEDVPEQEETTRPKISI